jgi:hypothetical protein
MKHESTNFVLTYEPGDEDAELIRELSEALVPALHVLLRVSRGEVGNSDAPYRSVEVVGLFTPGAGTLKFALDQLAVDVLEWRPGIPLEVRMMIRKLPADEYPGERVEVWFDGERITGRGWWSDQGG